MIKLTACELQMTNSQIFNISKAPLTSKPAFLIAITLRSKLIVSAIEVKNNSVGILNVRNSEFTADKSKFVNLKLVGEKYDMFSFNEIEGNVESMEVENIETDRKQVFRVMKSIISFKNKS
jgi:hypothetical protein